MLFHVWFATKYRRPVLVGETSRRAKELFWECAGRHEFEVLEVGTNIDHAHLLLRARDKEHLAAIVRTLKCVSAKELLKTMHGSPQEGGKRSFWIRRYGFEEKPESALDDIRRYIQEQDK